MLPLLALPMESLDGTTWDVAIAGTGLQPALLALALSRSGKKILHLDSNAYYGGAEAALSLSEAEDWAKGPANQMFKNVTVEKPETTPSGPKLSPPRAYSLSLSPSVLYTRSALLPALVSSKAHEQLEFLAVGSWFVWNALSTAEGSFVRVPNSREDIFSDENLSLRTKSALVKFLRFVAVYQDDDKRAIWEPRREASFADLLANHFKIQADIQGPLLALTMSAQPRDDVKVEEALSSIYRHLTSMGVFGAGFSVVLPKYGGLSEVVQVACRAAAVGGAVYVLARTIESVNTTAEAPIAISLEGGESVKTTRLFCTNDQLPAALRSEATQTALSVCSRGIYIVGSKLTSLFPIPTSGILPPSAAVVVLPSGSLTTTTSESNRSPIHILVHSSDTGECPSEQCVLYASTIQSLGEASHLLDLAVQKLLSSNDASSSVLWRMRYEVHSTSSAPELSKHAHLKDVYQFVEAPPQPVFDDSVLESVKEAWKLVTDGEDQEFMRFTDRNAEQEVEVNDSDEDEQK